LFAGSGEEEARMSRTSVFLLVLLVLVIGLVAGVFSLYTKNSSLETELDRINERLEETEQQLREARFQVRLGELRDLSARLYWQVNRNNFDTAGEISTRYFDALRRLSDSVPGSELASSLEELLARRDEVTARLARADSGVGSMIEQIFVQTHNATAEAQLPAEAAER